MTKHKSWLRRLTQSSIFSKAFQLLSSNDTESSNDDTEELPPEPLSHVNGKGCSYLSTYKRIAGKVQPSQCLSCEKSSNMALPSSSTIVASEVIANRFEIFDTLGSGAYGHVVRARDITTNNTVAIKTISKDKIPFTQFTNDRTRGHIPKEAFILSRLNHPNIIGFIDILQDTGNYYLITQYSTNNVRDLFDFIDQHSATLLSSRCRRIFKQVVSAIEYLHSKEYVHRDIKDENVLIDENDNIFVIDFGNAGHIPVSFGDFFTNVCGTPHAMAPEVSQRRPHQGVKGDIWSLGILLYTLLYGEIPFQSEAEMMSGVNSLPHRRKRGGLVMNLLEQMLQLEPENRISLEEITKHSWMTASDETIDRDDFTDDKGNVEIRDITSIRAAKRVKRRTRSVP